jgi:hypothetical protein
MSLSDLRTQFRDDQQNMCYAVVSLETQHTETVTRESSGTLFTSRELNRIIGS